METTRRARLGTLVRLSACGLLVAGALVLPSTAGAAQVAQEAPAGVLRTATSTLLSQQVTDGAGVLDDDAAQEVVNQLAEAGAGLWVVTFDDASLAAESYAAQAWDDSHLGTQDLMLVINTSDSGRTYAFGGAAQGGVWSEETIDQVRSAIYARLREGDYDGAVRAVLTGLGSADDATAQSTVPSSSTGSGSSGSGGFVGTLGVLALVGGGTLVYAR